MQKVIGIVNMLSGVIEIIIGVPYILFTIPKLMEMYASLSVDLPYNPLIAYLYPLFLIIFGIVNLLVGLGNFNILIKNKSELFNKVGLILVILSFILTGLVISTMINSIINPLYSLSTTL